MQSHVCRVCACLAVTCHLHFWQNDRDLLRTTEVTWVQNGYWPRQMFVLIQLSLSLYIHWQLVKKKKKKSKAEGTKVKLSVSSDCWVLLVTYWFRQLTHGSPAPLSHCPAAGRVPCHGRGSSAELWRGCRRGWRRNPNQTLLGHRILTPSHLKDTGRVLLHSKGWTLFIAVWTYTESPRICIDSQASRGEGGGGSHVHTHTDTDNAHTHTHTQTTHTYTHTHRQCTHTHTHTQTTHTYTHTHTHRQCTHTHTDNAHIHTHIHRQCTHKLAHTQPCTQIHTQSTHTNSPLLSVLPVATIHTWIILAPFERDHQPSTVYTRSMK